MTVDRGDVAQRIVAHGSLQPVQTVTVGSQVSGILEEIHVDFNSRVERGQVLARIDPSTFEAAVRSAEAELEASEASLELARLQWQRIQTLRENRIVPASEVDQATANLRGAEAQLTVRRHALERAQRELDRCTIYSPTDGMVISRNVDVGQTVAASLSAPELFQIATDLSSMRIHAMVSEADIGTVEEGQTVRFNVDAHRGRPFEGEVIQVRNAPMMESNVVHYETIIAVDNRDGLLKPGMTAEVAIITAEAPDALRVRNTALRARLPDAYDPESMELAQAKITDLLRERHRLGPDQPDDFTVQTQEEVAEAATETSRVMTFLLASIAGISLFVGGIGIMNVMLVSVGERTREIGLRLSVGAKGRDVLSQFLVEAVVLCLLGGVGGILIGVVATEMIARTAGWPALFSTEAMIVAVTVSGAVGLFFGFYPAWKASRLDPIVALRRE